MFRFPRNCPRRIKDFLPPKQVKSPRNADWVRKNVIETDENLSIRKFRLNDVRFKDGKYEIATSVLRDKKETNVRFYKRGYTDEEYSGAYRFFKKFSYLELLLTLTCGITFVAYETRTVSQQLNEQENQLLRYNRKTTGDLFKICCRCERGD